MKFLFYPQGCLPIHGSILAEKPLGGTETGIVHLSRELAKLGHEVIVLTAFENPPLSNPLYLPYHALQDVGSIDVLIAVREWGPLLLPLEARHRLFWSGDSYDQPQNLGLGDLRVAERIDAFLAVSEWHADRICAESRFPRHKAWPIGNGVVLENFAGSEIKRRKRLIYSSTPYRGLQFVPALYRELAKRHPDIELQVFSGYDVYGGGDVYGSEALTRFNELSRSLASLPNCTVRGNVLQRELAREFMKSAILFYPNSFEETSCITALEAQAGGCAVVTSHYGALPETVGDAGILIPGIPGSTQYLTAFLQASERLLSDDALWTELSRNGLRRAQEFDWSRVATRLLQHLSQT